MGLLEDIRPVLEEDQRSRDHLRTACHESGHALAAYISAPALGRSHDDVLGSITTGVLASQTSFDGFEGQKVAGHAEVLLWPEAWRNPARTVAERHGEGEQPPPLDRLQECMSEVKALMPNWDKAVAAMAMVLVAGTAAESLVFGEEFTTLWRGQSAGHDRQNLLPVFALGLDDPADPEFEAKFHAFSQEAAARFSEHLRQPQHWQAFGNLVVRVYRYDYASKKTVLALIREALGDEGPTPA